MITGNLAMLMGVAPQIHEWYLAVYADAYEWVEMPNVLGMSQFADGGLLGSKPYAAGGNYINKMSDYCRSCAYDVKQKTGPRACPFNYLYWDFLARNRDKLEGNPRLGPVYRTWDKMSADKREATRESARAFIRDPDRAARSAPARLRTVFDLVPDPRPFAPPCERRPHTAQVFVGRSDFFTVRLPDITKLSEAQCSITSPKNPPPPSSAHPAGSARQ